MKLKLLSLCCFVLAFSLYVQMYIPRDLLVSAAYTETPKDAVFVSGTNFPIRLTIQSLAINVPIFPGFIDGGKWYTTSKGVTVVNSSDISQNTSGLILYGHNWPSILGKLHELEYGESIKLIFDMQEKEYTVISKQTVASTNIAAVLTDAPDTLVLYTCTGFLDRQRLVVVARLKS